MSSARRVITLHAPLGRKIAYELLGRVEKTLIDLGATRVWISTESLPDLAVMCEVPDEEMEAVES